MPPLVLHGGCHCGAISYTISTSTDERLQCNYCHCDDCRKTLGFWFGLAVEVKQTQFKINTNPESALVPYASSGRVKRTHCGVCSAFITWEQTGDENVYVHAATIELPQELKESGKGLFSLFEPTMHMFLQSQWKGGAGVLLLGDGLRKYQGMMFGSPVWEPTEDVKLPPVETEVDDKETIEGSCHCGGIKFSIQRPPKDYANDPVLASWVKNGRKLTAQHCFCNTCRKVSGAPFWTWAFVPRKLLTFTSTATERIYSSHPTKPIARRFCGTCGCNYSYAAGPDVEMWDISAALLCDSKDDKMERWLAFGPTEGTEDPTDKVLDNYHSAGWAVGEDRPMSFKEDGEVYVPELLSTIREGRRACKRF